MNPVPMSAALSILTLLVRRRIRSTAKTLTCCTRGWKPPAGHRRRPVIPKLPHEGSDDGEDHPEQVGDLRAAPNPLERSVHIEEPEPYAQPQQNIAPDITRRPEAVPERENHGV